MQIHGNVSLKPYNTFGIDVVSRYFVELTSREGIEDFVRRELPYFPRYLFLGGGSNLLFAGDFEGIVLAVRNRGICFKDQDDGSCLVTAMAGEPWDDLVASCVDRGLGGIENLSLIPGNTGSAPIQNIGAYGVELSDVFHRCTVVMTGSGQSMELSATDCRFGYRDSIFQHTLKDQAVITSVTLRLRKDNPVNLSYDALAEELLRAGITTPGYRDVRSVVSGIRRAKLPDPAQLGNAGSFFKNPCVEERRWSELREKFPGIPGHRQPDGTWKLAAGWLIEQSGWKGNRIGDAGVHGKQALVLVNHGNATGSDILHLASEIRRSVLENFDLSLETEVNVITGAIPGNLAKKV